VLSGSPVAIKKLLWDDMSQEKANKEVSTPQCGYSVIIKLVLPH
jgi:hypothetical protein